MKKLLKTNFKNPCLIYWAGDAVEKWIQKASKQYAKAINFCL